MSVFDFFRNKPRPAEPKASIENPAVPLSAADAYFAAHDGGDDDAPYGAPVTPKNAMAVATVYRCVSLIAGTIASLPFGVYIDDPDKGRIADPTHRLDSNFSLRPLKSFPQTSFQWKEMTVRNILLTGNGFSQLIFDGAARVIGWRWLDPATVSVSLSSQNRVQYKIQPPGGAASYVLDQEQCLHFVGLSENGLTGVSRIHHNAKNAIALARTLEHAAGRAHENAIRPSVGVEMPTGMKPEQAKALIAHITSRFAGRANVGKPFFMDSGTKITPYTIMPLTDLATISAMNFSVAEISRIFGVPLALLNESEGTTSWGTGVDSLIRGFLRFTLDTDLHRIENEFNSKLFGDTGDENYVLFDRSSLLSMDALAQAQAESAEINSGVLTINEARFRKHRPPVEGGDQSLVNTALAPISVVAAKAAQPPSEPPETGGQQNEEDDPKQNQADDQGDQADPATDDEKDSADD